MPHSIARSAVADQTIDLMSRAGDANRADPCRNGLLLELPAEGEVMVTGDLHGNRANLDRIIHLANLPRRRRRRLVLQELVHDTDECAEACRSHALVELAAGLKIMFPHQVCILLGNHEFAELLQLAIGKNGRDLNAAFDEGGRRLYGRRWPEVKAAYDGFWRTCPVAVRSETGLFISHSTPRMGKGEALSLDYLRATPPDVAFRRESPLFDLLWGRDYRADTAEAFARKMQASALIVGHTPCEDGMEVPNSRHVVLDCKDYRGRYLLLPLDRPMTQKEILTCARRLYD